MISHNGCPIRIVIADADSQYVRLRDEVEQDPITLTVHITSSQRAFEPLRDCGAAHLRYQGAPRYNSIFCFDDEMFVTTHLYATLGNMQWRANPAYLALRDYMPEHQLIMITDLGPPIRVVGGFWPGVFGTSVIATSNFVTFASPC
jgi:hypothetical protein